MLAGGLALVLLACGTNGDGGTAGQATRVTLGYVSAVDQMGAAVALDLGFYEEAGLDVTLAQPFPTGVDALNALSAGDVDFVQVGVPSFGAVLEGMDLVYLGNYSGSATRLGIDETMAVVAEPDSGINPDDLSTLAGKRIGVSEGTINHLYLLNLLKAEGIPVSEVRIVNTPPPDMAVALQTGGVDAIAAWDPWPITARESVDGAFEVVRGGGYLAYIGYLVSTREYLEGNRDAVSALLTARAAADRWIRQHPDEAAGVTVRWIPGTELEVAKEAMRYNIVQLDPRFSACNYLALDTMVRAFAEQGVIEGTYDPNDHMVPDPVLEVMAQRPELFEDLPDIPEAARISPGYVFRRAEAEQACPAG
ncbi:ABC transporter substrate-binding protein [Amycolatopsis cihanbeyliensis]|nr:ABC transporter substrate-binding protein [Amycolatopsis cihanbeyliensis]